MRGRASWVAGGLALAFVAGSVSSLAAIHPAEACGSGYIRGTIVYSLEPFQPVVGQIVEATPVSGSEWAAWTQTASDGSFNLGCLDPGTWYEYWVDVDGGDHSLLFALTTDTPGSLMAYNDDNYVAQIDAGSPTLITSLRPSAPPTDAIRIPAAPSSPITLALPEGGTRPVQLVPASASSASTPSQDLTISANGVELRLAASTLVSSASPTWDGRLLPPSPTVLSRPDAGVDASSGVVVIEVGSTAATLSLSAPARLAISGAAGRSAGFVPVGGSFTAIAARCSADSAAGLGAATECVIDVGPELVIWTTHFTTFAAYTPAATLPPTGPADLQPLLGLAIALSGFGMVLLLLRRRTHTGTISRNGRTP